MTAQYAYDTIKQRYPVISKTPCTQLLGYLQAIQGEIDAVYKNNALSISNATRRGNNSIIEGFQKYLAELQAVYANSSCDAQVKEQAQQQDLQTNVALLEQTQKLSTKTDKTATYIVIALIIVIVIVSLTLLKKKNG